MVLSKLSTTWFTVAALLGAAPYCAMAQTDRAGSTEIKAARTLFSKYVALGHAFDAGVANLYADDALIRNKRTYPNGQVRELSIPAPQYKELLRRAMPLAKARGDTSEYSNCTYMGEVSGVRIVCQRYSNLKNYTSPISLLVGPGSAGSWRIIEELSESQP